MSVDAALCQPGKGASCGACCGLYNFTHHTRAELGATLVKARQTLKDAPRTREAFRERAQQLRAAGPAPLFPMVRVCPLLGFLDDAHTQVGCLAHPLVIGVDLRDCGAYTSDICEGFTCPSHTWLTQAQAELVQATCPDWYLYGLVITDVEWVKTTLSLVERERAAPVDPRAILRRPSALEACRALLALKETAPNRPSGAPIFGAFEPAGDPDAEPVLRVLDYAKLGAQPAPEDQAVLCLGYRPRDAAALEASRALVRTQVQALAHALD